MENTQRKKVSSITGKLHRAFVWKRIGFFVIQDMILFILMIIGALALQEHTMIRADEVIRHRFLSANEDAAVRMEQVFYNVTNADGDLLMQIYLLPIVKTAGIIIICLAVFQLVMTVGPWVSETRQIRRILSPLTDLAVKADELNRMSFGEDKYRRIEDAIERMQVDEEQKLSFGDEDLRGIEAAMNNLLMRMREANMQQARFVNDASHELRTPIAVIGGYADLLDRWGKSDEKILAESIEAIKNESGHMNRLVEQLLFLARGDAGKTVLEKVTFDANAFLKEIYEESLMIDESHVYQFRPLDDADVTLTADRGLLKQAMRILIDNAAKYTKAGDEILMCVGKETSAETGLSHICLQVQDTGQGMREADVTHMFDRFYRSEEVRDKQGTGLGLSIAKWIIDKHGAHFEVLSREGLGTRIRIVMP